MRLLGDSNAAQDAVERAFVRIPGNFAAASGSAGNDLSIRLFRSVGDFASRYLAGPDRHKRGKKNPAHVLAGAAGEALAAVRKLDITGLQVVVLRIFEGKSRGETGLITGLSEDCVDEVLRKSIIKTAEELKKAGLL